ncbi:MAG: helicase-related protein [Thermodesulfobacteriota bacterium]
MKSDRSADGGAAGGFTSKVWSHAYRTSSCWPDGRQVSILHDFYIPALKLASRYDRMAGYFRSTSLAAASQGFSAFTGHGGRMRLVVGADLDGQDVTAILNGDQERLAKHLNAELAEPAAWPEEVTRGVELLAWMVANDFLDVRVAFRVHGATGKPLAFTSIEDGYVHEKWAVFGDEEGNRLYISGSLNESKTALALNAENIDLHADWWSERDRLRIDDAETTFLSVWQDQSPYIRVMPLPEAVRRRLLAIAEQASLLLEIDGSTSWRRDVAPPSALERLTFALIEHGPKLPGGRFVGMETAPVAPWPHQEVVARRLIATWPYSYLLCDEVGLGKTIEAGLAIRSLVLSGMAKRVLITPPASLAKQWQRELAQKFFLSFGRAVTTGGLRHEYIFPEEKAVAATSLYQADLALVSTGLLSRQDRSQDLLGRHFDIVLVDEAHYARRQNPAAKDICRTMPRFGRLYETIRDHLRQKTDSLWLATATPMQIGWIEVYDLIRLTNRIGLFQHDPTLTWAYYGALGKLVRRQRVSEAEWQFLRAAIRALDRQDPFFRRYLDQAVIDGRIRSAVRQWLDDGRIPRGSDAATMQRLIFAAAPLSRVMLRHTRPLLEIYREQGKLGAKLAKRTILPIPRIAFTELEAQAYRELESFCQGLTEQLQRHGGNTSSPFPLMFLLCLLRLRFSSSLYAIRETLRRRLDRVRLTREFHQQENDTGESSELEGVDDEESDDKAVAALLSDRTPKDLAWEEERLTAMLSTLADLTSTPSKMQELFRVLDRRRLSQGRIRQTVIFTKYFDTLIDIVNRLRTVDQSMLIGTFSGQGGQYVDPRTRQLKGIDREEIKQRFLREEIDVLVCTDAAAEGLNLQTADLLINFDLPWNPMKVEQRIGRIDRIGQRHDEIMVLNFCYVDSVEEAVYGRLLQRLREAGAVVGAQQISMLPITEEDFRALAEGKTTPQRLEEEAKKRIIEQRKRTEGMELPARELYEMYVRLADQEKMKPAPVTLDGIWQAVSQSRYLHDLGCMPAPSLPMFVVQGVDGIPDRTMLTVDRELFDRGIPGQVSRPHFATYGEPYFHALVSAVTSHEWPPCVRILKEIVDDIGNEVVCFAVACRQANGKKEARLVGSLRELQSVAIDDEAVLDDKDLVELKKQFRQMVREEFMPTRAVGNLERENLLAADAQALLDLVLVQGFLKMAKWTSHDNFWSAIKDLAGTVEEQKGLTVYNLAAAPLRNVAERLSFPVQIPQLGETAGMQVPQFLAESAIDAGCRIADSMRKRRSELTVGEVLSRLDREIANNKYAACGSCLP